MINLHEEPQVDILWGRLFSYVLLNVLPFDVYPLKNRQIATNRIQLHKHFPKNSITNKMTEIEADNFHQKINCSRYSPYWGTKRPYEGTVLWEISPPASLSMWHFSLVSLKQIDIQVTVQVTQSPAESSAALRRWPRSLRTLGSRLGNQASGLPAAFTCKEDRRKIDVIENEPVSPLTFFI